MPDNGDYRSNEGTTQQVIEACMLAPLLPSHLLFFFSQHPKRMKRSPRSPADMGPTIDGSKSLPSEPVGAEASQQDKEKLSGYETTVHTPDANKHGQRSMEFTPGGEYMLQTVTPPDIRNPNPDARMQPTTVGY
jgi:hypothetical protein